MYWRYNGSAGYPDGYYRNNAFKNIISIEESPDILRVNVNANVLHCANKIVAANSRRS